ncbi:pyruvate kinase [Pseudomaricurvus alkylphenolicus]|uniref:pyruvate kinase n=1 Tax=Pseudomaricurvus alkylphenolicus TaxID=1306991 RepID=UPI0014238914|nr:pyruvate kinase [Pseudomaricurvus alkylphenolicus]NIB44256.1 pyruvate kinase [Pseudomaricurvus alkylphenolicus]
MRKTKIICTIGPATESLEMLEKLYHAGMNVVRLNMSHGDHESHAKVIRSIRTLNKRVKHPIPILLDTQGPEIRTGDVARELDLHEGSEVTIAVRGAENVEETSIHINYDDLVDSVSDGDMITVDNGLINLEVLEKHERQLRCKVIDGGVLKSKRHVNLPGIRVNLPAITEKDRRDVLFAMEQELDFIALSFVRRAEDIEELRQLLGDKANKIKIIAKIEDQEGLGNLEEIIDAADGVMVARGDLGVEISVELLPNEQRRMVRLCVERGKRVIVATHLLESMIDNPIPTRAEVTDVANAIYEGADAVMLSGETTIGKYPVKCVEILDKIADASEREPGLQFARNLHKNDEKQHLAHATVSLAESLRVKGIVVITRRGFMANLVTNCQPHHTPVYAFTNDARTRRQLLLNRSVYPFRMEFSQDPEKTLLNAFRILVERSDFVPGDQVVVISDIIAGSGVDAVQVREIPVQDPEVDSH